LIFRTQRNGTLLHILGVGDKFIRLSVQGKKVVLEVPETDSFTTSVFGKRANDGKWHTVKILNKNGFNLGRNTCRWEIPIRVVASFLIFKFK